jgi:hypothetical protein
MLWSTVTPAVPFVEYLSWGRNEGTVSYGRSGDSVTGSADAAAFPGNGIGFNAPMTRIAPRRTGLTTTAAIVQNAAGSTRWRPFGTRHLVRTRRSTGRPGHRFPDISAPVFLLGWAGPEIGVRCA